MHYNKFLKIRKKSENKSFEQWLNSIFKFLDLLSRNIVSGKEEEKEFSDVTSMQ